MSSFMFVVCFSECQYVCGLFQWVSMCMVHFSERLYVCGPFQWASLRVWSISVSLSLENLTELNDDVKLRYFMQYLDVTDSAIDRTLFNTKCQGIFWSIVVYWVNHTDPVVNRAWVSVCYSPCNVHVDVSVCVKIVNVVLEGRTRSFCENFTSLVS